MSYVAKVLQPDEKVRFATKTHWIIYLPGLALAALAIVTYWVAVQPVSSYQIWKWISLVLLAGAAVSLFSAWFKRWTTEIAVTSKRVIYKRGFIRRDTMEMALSKIESVDVSQSIGGRILDYGNLMVHGTGDTHELLPMIAAPIEFRNHVTAE